MTPTQFRDFRKRLGLSQQALATILGMSRRQVGKYETGGADVPKVVRLACAAIALGLSDFPT